jgi:hypothetical protein
VAAYRTLPWVSTLQSYRQNSLAFFQHCLARTILAFLVVPSWVLVRQALSLMTHTLQKFDSQNLISGYPSAGA